MPLSEPVPEQLVSAVIDYEPPSHRLTSLTTVDRCATRPALHPHGARRLRLVDPAAAQLPHAAAVQFADLALRRVLEVMDRRRPPTQLQNLMAPSLIDTVVALTRMRYNTTATLRRVRIRVASPGAAEVFATYTRGPRVRAIAARIDFADSRWQLTALQVG